MESVQWNVARRVELDEMLFFLDRFWLPGSEGGNLASS